MNEDVVISPFERVEIEDKDGVRVEVNALIDTGARVSSIDMELAKNMGVYDENKILFMGKYSSALGKQKRPVINLTYYLFGKKIKTTANVSDRSGRSRKFLVGRRDLVGFLVKVDKGDDIK